MPTGMQRAYTTYDVYRDYNSEDLLNDVYPIDGVFSPQPLDGRLTPQTPLQGSQRTGSATKVRPQSRAHSRMDVGVQFADDIQTEKKVRPLPFETQYNYAIPDTGVRPTSPVMRLLERAHTQPFMSLQGPSTGPEMDPITRQYYHRLWKSQSPGESVNVNRYGRAGGVWRHVRACVANTGTQLAFIDGTVKEEDNVYFPPWNKSGGQSAYTNYPPLNWKRGVPKTQKSLPPKSATYRNSFNSHAKSGFKYWYQEPKPIDLRGPTTRLRARIVGNGY